MKSQNEALRALCSRNEAVQFKFVPGKRFSLGNREEVFPMDTHKDLGDQSLPLMFTKSEELGFMGRIRLGECQPTHLVLVRLPTKQEEAANAQLVAQARADGKHLACLELLVPNGEHLNMVGIKTAGDVEFYIVD